MRSFTALCAVAAASALSASAVALPSESQAKAAPRVVQHTIQRRKIANVVEADRRRMMRRSGTVQVSLANEETLYFMQATIGTPEQTLELHIDTGSSDLWVNVADSSLCESSGSPCGQSGTFNPNSSSTWTYLNNEFQIKYADGSGAQGVYGTDTVGFGGITIENQQFGVGYESTTPQGLIGIGYALNEAEVAYDGGKTYANVPVSLAQDGIINTNAYSLWLNDLNANTGTILFGGVNTARYSGTLETLPVISENGYYQAFYIALTAVGANGNTGSIASNIAYPALLDSGTSLMYLPDNIAQTIFNAVGATYNSAQGYAEISCNARNSDYTLDFTFSSPTIKVPMSELVFIAEESAAGTTCILGIAKAGNTAPVLGDTFLRSAYVVYDLDNNQISIAQTNFNGGNDNIEEITKSSGVPGAQTVTNPVTSVTTNFASSSTVAPSNTNFSGAVALTPGLALALISAIAGSLLMAVF